MNVFFLRQHFWSPAVNLFPPVFLAVGILLVAGCHKKTEVKPTADSGSEPAQVPAIGPGMVAASPPRVVAVAVADNGDATAQLAQLTQVLRRFGAEQRRVPQTLDELTAAGYLSALPAAPAGKQFVIDGKHMQVVLANK
jgi:hypothetical protein